MTVQAWIIMTEEEHEAATLLDGDGVAIGGRLVDNPMADNLGEGVLVGRWVVAARLLNDPDYTRWVPSLGSLPIRTMDSDVLFAPEE